MSFDENLFPEPYGYYSFYVPGTLWILQFLCSICDNQCKRDNILLEECDFSMMLTYTSGVEDLDKWCSVKTEEVTFAWHNIARILFGNVT